MMKLEKRRRFMNKKEKISALLKHCEETPKVTIMMPTNKQSPDNKKDKIQFKNLVQKCRNILEDKYSPPTYEEMLEKLYGLYEDTIFWSYSTEGLVVLGCHDKIETFRLSRSVEALAKVSQIFDLRPIMAFEESIGLHYLVDLAKDRFKLFTIRDHDISEITDHEVKNTFSKLYDDFDYEGNLNVGSYGGLQGMYHGHRDKSLEIKKDRERFFRYLDREFQHLHKERNSHFFFAGTKENISAFKNLAQEKFYHDLAIEKPLSSLKNKEFDDKIENITKTLKEESIQKINKELHDAEHNQKLIRHIEDIKKGIEEQRLAKLYIKGNVPYHNNYDEILFKAVKNNVDSSVIYSDEIVLEEDVLGVLW